MDRPSLDPATATEYEIAAAATLMHGRALAELAESHWSGKTSSKLSKGGAGAIVESYFRIKQNSDQEPDFRGAGIELKVAPLVMDGEKPKRIKERTSVSMIDFIALDRESWATATVRKKLRRILFVFYGWKAGVPLGELRVIATRFWSPPDDMLPFLERDWSAVWTKNHRGLAHEISEGDGLLLGACTKGATGAMKPQPHSAELAKSRAWSLKPRLTWTIYASTVAERLGRELLLRLQRVAPAEPVDALLHQLEALVGMSIRDIADRKAIKAGAGKNRASKVIREAIGLRGTKLPTGLEALGLELKTIPLGPNAYPHEAMSFPAFDPLELAGEEWEDSELCGRLQNMLLVPLFRERRDDDLMSQRVCRPFRWTPDREQTSGIRAEWERYRDLFASGQVYGLPTSQETQFIHVRPHGRDGRDTVVVPGGRAIVRQSFWLNQAFVQELVRSHHSNWMGF